MLTTSATSGSQAIADLISDYTGQGILPDELQLIAIGASGRSIMRPCISNITGLLGIYWTADRADNASFVPAARGLASSGISVPEIYAVAEYGNGCGACLVQDLGTTDLYSIRHEPWEIRKNCYRSALLTLSQLHQLQPDWTLQPPFDENLYRWEQEYFAEHIIGRHLGLNPECFLSQPPLREMAVWLASLPRRPVHRDSQSQNIMLYENKAWLIDFQGMRLGRPEYDIASLICDPYVQMKSEEQDELLTIYEEINHESIDRAIYAACSLQRLMQALGAYANIGYNQQRDFYLDLIPAGLDALYRAVALAPTDSLAAKVATCLPAIK